jgi:endonuclease YncB( thermonuclease family)
MRKTTVAAAIAAFLGLVATMLVSLSTPAGATFLDRDCGDFPSQAAAQNFFLANGGPHNDPHRLDDEGDGIACESNPCPCIGRGNPGGQTNGNTSNQNNNPGPRLYRETGNVTQVVDGDTLKVRLKSGPVVSVRMLGINTPERGRCGYGEATDNLRRLAPVGSTVDLVSDRTQAAKDRYGRLLRYVAKRGGFKDLSYRQAYNGFTKRYVFGGKPVARDGQYVRAIASARNNTRGLWGSCW